MTYDKHLKEIVEKLLERDPRCRKDIKWLTYRVMRVFTKGKFYIPFKDFNVIPSFESVARCRRDVMNKEGKYSKDFTPEENIIYEKPLK